MGKIGLGTGGLDARGWDMLSTSMKGRFSALQSVIARQPRVSAQKGNFSVHSGVMQLFYGEK
tara:strand:+ start:655 stop:840 length:186 start_codon:yes stop_codon:yes gene_type:complete